MWGENKFSDKAALEIGKALITENMTHAPICPHLHYLLY